MDGGRRRGVAPIPADIDKYLSDVQLSGLHKIERSGWSIKYIRRATVVLVYKDGSTLGLLDEDGTLNHKVVIRERASSSPPFDENSLKPGKYMV